MWESGLELNIIFRINTKGFYKEVQILISIARSIADVIIICVGAGFFSSVEHDGGIDQFFLVKYLFRFHDHALFSKSRFDHKNRMGAIFA